MIAREHWHAIKKQRRRIVCDTQFKVTSEKWGDGGGFFPVIHINTTDMAGHGGHTNQSTKYKTNNPSPWAQNNTVDLICMVMLPVKQAFRRKNGSSQSFQRKSSTWEKFLLISKTSPSVKIFLRHILSASCRNGPQLCMAHLHCSVTFPFQ